MIIDASRRDLQKKTNLTSFHFFCVVSESKVFTMESIKHKMTILAKETEAANQRTREATAAAQMEEEKAENFEDEVLKAQKKVSIVEFKRNNILTQF